MLRRYYILQGVLSLAGLAVMVAELSRLPDKVSAAEQQFFINVLAHPLLAPAIFRTVLPRS